MAGSGRFDGEEREWVPCFAYTSYLTFDNWHNHTTPWSIWFGMNLRRRAVQESEEDTKVTKE
jgi:hypothetical protein